MRLRRLVAVLAVTALTVLTLHSPAEARTLKSITWNSPMFHTMKKADKYMPGAPMGLKKAVVRQARKVVVASGDCEFPSGAQMGHYVSTGYATGQLGGCGGAVAIYTDYGNHKRHGGQWRLVLTTQEETSCSFNRSYKMPSSIVGDQCWGPTRADQQPYHQR